MWLISLIYYPWYYSVHMPVYLSVLHKFIVDISVLINKLNMSEWVCVCVYEWVRESELECECERVSVSVRGWVCVCVWERERKRKSVRVSECVCHSQIISESPGRF
jgi:hypothetical protein